MQITREHIGWALVAAGGLCAAIAGAISGGWAGFFSAAAGAFGTAAVSWGYVNKTPAA